MTPEGAADQGSRALRFSVLLLLVLGVVGFGLASLCGGAFTIGSLGGGDHLGGVWVISVPSLLIGAGLCWWCARKLLKVWRGDAA